MKIILTLVFVCLCVQSVKADEYLAQIDVQKMTSSEEVGYSLNIKFDGQVIKVTNNQIETPLFVLPQDVIIKLKQVESRVTETGPFTPIKPAPTCVSNDNVGYWVRGEDRIMRMVGGSCGRAINMVSINETSDIKILLTFLNNLYQVINP